jgi:hypothetical protein
MAMPALAIPIASADVTIQASIQRVRMSKIPERRRPRSARAFRSTP